MVVTMMTMADVSYTERGRLLLCILIFFLLSVHFYTSYTCPRASFITIVHRSHLFSLPITFD